MKNLLLHFFVLSCLLFSATFKLTAQQGHHISATDKTSVHGMLIFFATVGVNLSNLKYLQFPDAPVWSPTNGHHDPTVNSRKKVSAF